MSLSRVKTWVAGEVLSAADLNAEFNNLLNNAGSLIGGASVTSTLTMSGAALEFAAEADVASATTTDIGAATSNNVRITGTTTITGLGTVAAGATRFVRFSGALTLTYNATSLILPGAANITTAAGDSMLARSLGSGNWKIDDYTRAAVVPLHVNYNFTTIELGAGATDTTLTRVSAGVAAIEGSNILLASGLGSVTQAYSAVLAAYAAGASPTAAFLSIVDDASVGAIATTLGLGTASLPQHAQLGLGTAAVSTRGLTISNGSAGGYGVHVTVTDTNATGYYAEPSGSAAYGGLFHCTNASFAGTVMHAMASRAGNTAYKLFVGQSNGGSDTEFSVDGVGTVAGDGALYTSPADDAEMLEWEDGNPLKEDRVGYTVVAVEGTDYVRLSAPGDDPEDIIGAISGNAAVKKGTAWSGWIGKHLKDEFNRNILNKDGSRKRNPEYKPELHANYKGRHERPEWAIVGTAGRVPIRNGQIVHPRWKRRAPTSDTVTEWLVR